jgi:phosphoribosylaminoimidazolecarboxamide formyltransferase/IMP cyclohydrolase
VPRALISVADKAGLIPFARGLVALGWEVVASGGTAEALHDAGLQVLAVEDLGGVPEVLGGRVKTLQAQVHAAILARPDRPEDLEDLSRLGVSPIGLVAVNLYPFLRRPGIETIDIGGVALLRAAAKNHAHVVVLSDPADYARVLQGLQAGGLDLDMRRQLALKAFRHTGVYDAAIAAWLAGGGALADLPAAETPAEAEASGEGPFPAELPLGLVRAMPLRYGENPHQRAALYRDALPAGPSLLDAKQLQGKELSYNNLMDADAAWDLVWRFSAPAAVAVKHAGPCGVAIGRDAADAFRRAREADPVSIFGGIVAWNRPLDQAAAAAIGDLFLEVLIAPEVTPEAASALRTKKNLRVLACPAPEAQGRRDFRLRRISGGVLVQEEDRVVTDPSSWRCVTRRPPTAGELEELAFAWEVVRAVGSNAVVVSRDRQTVGVGGGQPNRIDPARHALAQAGARARGAVLASDGFFPFDDVVRAAAEAGIAAVVQPGGSLRDADSIAAADAAGIAMVMTGRRHFRH